MKDQFNPFGPFAGGPNIGGSPLENEDIATPRCPSCRSDNFHAWTTQYGLMRRCNECRQEWSGGTVAVARMDYSESLPHPDSPVPLDIPVTRYTGASFRDPSKNFGDDDY